MPLISLADGLDHARKHRYALGAFNVLDSHFLRALFAAARQERSPFIINIAEVHFKYVSLDSLVEAVKFEAARHDIPVVLNLDHGLHFESVVRALRLGFSSVMFDGSTLEYEENIRQTREVVKMCHAVGVSVEAELGAVGGDEGGALYGHADESLFTDPQLARDFVDRTGIDALAVAIGNAHGKYKGEPKLDFPRLDAIRQQTALPLVLHGASSVPQEAVAAVNAHGGNVAGASGVPEDLLRRAAASAICNIIFFFNILCSKIHPAIFVRCSRKYRIILYDFKIIR